MNFQELHERTLNWSISVGLIESGNKQSQLEKVFEELGEYLGAKNKGKSIEEQEMEFGDICVAYSVLAHMFGVTTLRSAEETLPDSWNPKNIKFQNLLPNMAIFSEFGAKFMNFEFHALDAYAANQGIDMRECWQMALEKIESRGGSMVNGNFVKNEDFIAVPAPLFNDDETEMVFDGETYVADKGSAGCPSCDLSQFGIYCHGDFVHRCSLLSRRDERNISWKLKI